MADQKIRLDLETKDFIASAEAAKQALEEIKDETYELAVTTNLHGRSVEEATSKEYALADVEKTHVTVVQAVEKAVQSKTDALKKQAAATEELKDKTDKTTSKVAGMGQSFLQTGRIVQDFTQGGIGGVLNNIEGLSMALGGGAGLAGAFTIVGVAAFIFKDKIKAVFEDYFPKVIDLSKSKIEELEAKLKELNDKPVKLSVDVAQIEQTKQQIKEIQGALTAIEAIRGSQTKLEKESSQAINEALVEGGGREAINAAIEREVVAQRQASPDYERLTNERRNQEAESTRLARLHKESVDQGMEPELVAANAKAAIDASNRFKETDELLKGLERRIADEASRIVGGEVKTATSGSGLEQQAAQQALASRLGGPLAEKLRGNSPQAIREWNEGINAQAEDEAREEAAAKAKEKADKLTDMLNEQGQQFQEDFQKDQDEEGAKEFDRRVREQARRHQKDLAIAKQNTRAAKKRAAQNTQAAKKRAAAQERFYDKVQKAQQNPKRAFESRTAELVAKGAGFMEAQQQANMETLALVNRNMQMFYQLQQGAERYTAMIRQMTRGMMGDDNAVPNLNMGGPGS